MDSKHLLIVAALSGLVLGASANEATKSNSDSKTMEGQCHGVNACKGKSACHGESNSCSGMNSCKGKGWMKMTEKECTEKKGKFKKS